MALYEDNNDSMQLVNPGEPAPEGYLLKGRMGPEGQEQDYYERPKSPTVGQEAPQGQMPPGGDINQFLDWAVKNKLGFNPLTMNPVTEALKTWNQNESKYFNQAFAGTGMSPTNMTPDALKFWNEQRKEGIAALMQEAQQKQQAGVAYLNMLKTGWEEANTVTDKVTLDPRTGEQVYTNKFGQIIKDPNRGTLGQPSTMQPGQMVAGGGAPSAPKTMGTTGVELPQTEGIVKPKTPKEAKQLSQESVNQLAEMATTYDRLVGIGKKLADKPDLAGPIQGRLNMLKVKYQNEGETQTVINELKSLITIAYALSGKQISEKEMKMLQEAMLPSLAQPHTNLMATIAFARDWLAESHNKRLEYQTASGYTHGIKPLAVGGQEPSELPPGWRKEGGVVYNDKGKKMKWRAE